MANAKLFRATERALYMYLEHKATVSLFEAKSSMRGHDYDKVTGVKTSTRSDPTALGGIALAEPPKNVVAAKKWVWAIETAWAELTAYAPERARLMEMYYGLSDPKGRPRERQPEVRRKIMEELHIGYATFYNWRSDCVDSVMHAAIQCGVLTPYKEKAPA